MFVYSNTLCNVIFQDSDGLVVAGRSLEHFEVTKVDSSTDVPVYYSQFLDQPCVLKVCKAYLVYAN